MTIKHHNENGSGPWSHRPGAGLTGFAIRGFRPFNRPLPDSRNRRNVLSSWRVSKSNEELEEQIAPLRRLPPGPFKKPIDIKSVVPGSIVFLQNDKRLLSYIDGRALWHHAVVLSVSAEHRDLVVATLTTFGGTDEAPSAVGRRMIRMTRDSSPDGQAPAIFSAENHLAVHPARALENGHVLHYKVQDPAGVTRCVVFLSLREVYLVPQQALWQRWHQFGGPDDRLSENSVHVVYEFMKDKDCKLISPWKEASRRANFENGELRFHRPLKETFSPPRRFTSAPLLQPNTSLAFRRVTLPLRAAETPGAETQAPQITPPPQPTPPPAKKQYQSCIDGLLKLGAELWPLPEVNGLETVYGAGQPPAGS